MNDAGEKRLPPVEAAHYLGITAELLFQFTKTNFAKSSGLRSLNCVEIEGKTRFVKGELDSFDKLLSGCWCGPNEPRPSIPKAILDHLRAESHNQCARCGSGVGVDTAHIIPWSKSRSHHPSNLIRICTACHREHDGHQSLSTQDLRKIKATLVERTRGRLGTKPSAQLETLRPPRSKDLFFGRDKELKKLTSFLQTSHSISVSGIGGIGKSELILQALKRSETGRRVLWFDLEKFQNISELLIALRTALSEKGVACEENEVPLRLDDIRACLVFDSIEQGSLGNLDDFEDSISQLLEQTYDTQFVLTTQVQLYRFSVDVSIKLERLDELASYLLLQKSFSKFSEDCEQALKALLAFCDGHPLAIQFSGALADYYGGAFKALNTINNDASHSLGYPGRNIHHRKTSMELCLNIAYSSLSINCKKLLWVLALSPAGLITEYLEDTWSHSDDSTESLAILRRWHFLTITPINEKISRTNLLGPIRQFVIRIAKAEQNDKFEEIVRCLIQEMGKTVAVLEYYYDSPDDTTTVIQRYDMELPNLLAAIRLSQEREHDQELVRIAVTIARSLMRYFFVLRLPQLGTSVMFDAAKMAIQSANFIDASALALQYMCLACRSLDSALIVKGINLVNHIEMLVKSTSDFPDLILSRAMASQVTGDFITAENCARQAIEVYRLKLTSKPDISLENDDVYNALGVLAFSQLSQRKYEEARDSYLQTLSLHQGSWAGVNLGQNLHQLANCDAYLGNFKSASENYLKALNVFQSVGMKEYISNAFGELGYTFLDFFNEKIIEELDEEQIECALSDLDECVLIALDAKKAINHDNFVGIIRKLFGSLILVSLTKFGEKLGSHFDSLEKRTITKLEEQFVSGERDSSEIFPINIIELIFFLGKVISKSEVELKIKGCLDDDTLNQFLYIEDIAPDWAHEFMRLSDWLSVYFEHKGIEQNICNM